jgi:hypothetical protein
MEKTLVKMGFKDFNAAYAKLAREEHDWTVNVLKKYGKGPDKAWIFERGECGLNIVEDKTGVVIPVYVRSVALAGDKKDPKLIIYATRMFDWIGKTDGLFQVEERQLLQGFVAHLGTKINLLSTKRAERI